MKLSAQESAEQRESLQLQNNHLVLEISQLQQLLSDVSSSGVEVKGQLSDFVKHENLIKEDSSDYFMHSEGFKKNEEIAPAETTDIYPKSEDVCDSSINTNGVSLVNLENTFNLSSLDKVDSENLKNHIYALLEKEILSDFEKNISKVNNHLNKKESEVEIKISLNEILSHMKPENHKLIEFIKEIEQKHQKEVEKLRTYFEERCAKMEKK